jgi:Tfp pilus assembly protein PilN
VQADRAAIKPLISATLVGRTSVENAFRQLAALAATQRAAPQWSDVISNLAVHLDEHSYLTSLRARDDSLLVEGIAVSAARAFDSMFQTPGLVSVKAAAPVRRESPQGGPALERFTIGAVVAHGPPAAAPSTAAKKVAP